MEKLPSERIKELASDFWNKRNDHNHPINQSAWPELSDWVKAIIKHLDEEHNRRQKEELKCPKR